MSTKKVTVKSHSRSYPGKKAAAKPKTSGGKRKRKTKGPMGQINLFSS